MKEETKAVLIFVTIIIIGVLAFGSFISSTPWVTKPLDVDGRIIKVTPVDDPHKSYVCFNVTFDTGHGVLTLKMDQYGLDAIDGYTGRMYLHLYLNEDSLLYHTDGIYRVGSVTKLDSYPG